MDKGSCILESEPFAYILSNSFHGKVCDHCFKSNEKLKRCALCKSSYYCDKKCQKSAWLIHKMECPNLRRISPNIPPDSVRLLAHIIFKLKLDGDNCYEMVNHKQRKFKHLKSHVEEITKDLERMKQFRALAVMLETFIGQEYLPEIPVLITYFGKMVINSITIMSGDLRPLGVGLYLGLSILNHSCKANATINFEGVKARVQTIEDLSQDNLNLVYISYINRVCEKSIRQKDLMDQYYFKCKCDGCQDNEFNSKITQVLNNNNAQAILDEIKKCEEASHSSDSSEEKMAVAVSNIKKTNNVLHDFHHVRVKQIQEAFDCSIELQLWHDALKYGEMLIQPYIFYYGQYDSSVGITLMKVGKIALYLEDYERAKRYLCQAEEVILVSFGVHHSIYHDVCDLKEQCQAESHLALQS